jgi:hypothetical protein
VDSMRATVTLPAPPGEAQEHMEEEQWEGSRSRPCLFSLFQRLSFLFFHTLSLSRALSLTHVTHTTHGRTKHEYDVMRLAVIRTACKQAIDHRCDAARSLRLAPL